MGQELLNAVERGPVLDLNCAAGRVALWFQERGFEVCAVDNYRALLTRLAGMASTTWSARVRGVGAGNRLRAPPAEREPAVCR